MKYDNHSLKGYLMRQHIGAVKSELARILLMEEKNELRDYDLAYKNTLIEVLQQRGESTDIDISSTLISYHPRFDPFKLVD